jgi:1,4-dihydroxy-2-naphthoate octaprenyltransferase
MVDSERGKAIRLIKVLLFSASIVPCSLAGAMAHASGHFSWPLFLVLLAALVLGQAGGDYLYYYFTDGHKDPRDAHTKIFAGWQPLLAGVLGRAGTLWAGIACLVVDLGIGIGIARMAGPQVLLFALAGGVIAVFFTPLMLRGFKEPVIFVAFGPLPVAAIIYVMTGRFGFEPVVASLPLAFLVTLVAHLKGARYRVVGDDGKEIVVKLGRSLVAMLAGAAYGSLVAGVAFGLMPTWTLMGLATVPITAGVVKAVHGRPNNIAEYLWATVHSIVALVVTGALMCAGYLV